MDRLTYLFELITESINRGDGQNVLNAFVQMLLELFNFVLGKMGMAPIELVN